MASAVGLSSPSTVHAHLSALEARGLLKRDATKPRALELFDEDGSSVSISKSDEPTAPRGTVSLPLVGRVAAGIPILAEQNIEDTFTIPTEIATDQGSFILEVHGSSMINVGIYNGDYIIVPAGNRGDGTRWNRRGYDRWLGDCQNVLQGAGARALAARERHYGAHLCDEPRYFG